MQQYLMANVHSWEFVEKVCDWSPTSPPPWSWIHFQQFIIEFPEKAPVAVRLDRVYCMPRRIGIVVLHPTSNEETVVVLPIKLAMKVDAYTPFVRQVTPAEWKAAALLAEQQSYLEDAECAVRSAHAVCERALVKHNTCPTVVLRSSSLGGMATLCDSLPELPVAPASPLGPFLSVDANVRTDFSKYLSGIVLRLTGFLPLSRRAQARSRAVQYFQPNQCSNTHCKFEIGHDGLCSHMLVSGKRQRKRSQQRVEPQSPG